MTLVLPFLAATAFSPAPALADKPNPFQSQIDKGRQYLLGKMKSDDALGYLAVTTLALLKTAPSHVSGPERGKMKKEPELQSMVDRLVRLIETKENDLNGHEGTYAVAACVSALIADDAGKHERLIRRLVARIISKQLPNGGWCYPDGHPEKGDTSQVQYIVLALWDASLIGVEIPPKVWDSALFWQVATQDTGGAGGPGGFAYNPTKISEDGKPSDQGERRATMGVAGLSTMLICSGQLPALKKKPGGGRGPLIIEEMLRPASDDPDDEGFMPKCTPDMVHPAIQRAEGWVARNSIFKGSFANLPGAYYYLYGYERVQALRKQAQGGAASKAPSNFDEPWFIEGGNWIVKQQKADGSWAGQWGDRADTSFALLFLGKTMEKKLTKIDVTVLNRSLAVGGSGGLPTADGSAGGSAFQRQYERYRTQPTSSIDELVKILEDPDKIVEEETTAQVEQLTPEQLKELVQKVGGDTKKLRQWAYDKRPEARKAALTALSKSRDPRFAPILFDALNEKDAGIYTAAREGLRYMSRNVEVFGLPDAAARTPEKIKVGIERGKEWFKTLNLEVAAYQEFTPPNP